MIKRLYFRLKNDVEQEKVLFLLTEVIVFVLMWSVFCFLYLTQPLDGFYMYYLESNPITTVGISILFSAIFLFLFTISSFCGGELIHRARTQVEHNKLSKSQDGWILIDSLVGMVILSTAVIALLGAFTQATKGTVVSTNRTQATYLAQQTLENLKAQDGNAIIDTSVISPVDKYTIVIGTPAVSAIANDTNHLSDYLKPYQVTVSWSDTSGGPTIKSVKMVGYCYVNVNP